MTLTARPRLLIRFAVLAALALGALVLALSSTGTPPVGAQDGSAPAQPTGLSTEAFHDRVNLTWDDPGDGSITHYQIFRRDRDVHDTGEFVTIKENTGSAAASYTDDSVQPEKRYVYWVKAVNRHGASNWSSFARANTPAAPTPEPNSPATGQPTISGTVQVGETLTANTSGIEDADGLTNVSFSYRWVRYDETTDSDISGATDPAYTLVEADESNAIRVRVSFTDDGGNPEELTSEATAAVEPAPLTTETSDKPESHNGTDAFTFRIAFSEDISISYTVFRDHSFETTNGSITRARRVNGSSSLWEITVEPDSDADVTVVLPVTTDCAAQGAVCTSEGRKLSNSVELTVAGPRGSGEGAVYTYEDSDRTLRVILQEDLVVRQTGSDVPTDRMVRRTAGGSIARSNFLYGTADLPVFRSPSGGGLMTLPGGVLLALDPEWDEARVERFFVENNIAQARISERDYMPNGFFVDTEPGFPSLELANTLAAQKGVVLSIPNWWLELEVPKDPRQTKGKDRKAVPVAGGIEPRNDGIDDAHDLPLDGSYSESINPAADVDYFKLDLSDQTGTTDVRIYTTGNVDTIGKLYSDPAPGTTLGSEQLLKVNDDSDYPNNFNFLLLASLPSGVYYVTVESYGSDTGAYTLHTETVPATSVSLGSSVDANIDTAGEVDYFRLDLSDQSGTTDVSLFTVSSDWAPGIEALFGSQARLSNENFFGDQTVLVHRSAEGRAADSQWFEVGSEIGTGSYTLRAQAVPDHGSTTDDATDLSLGVPTSGKLTSASDAEYFKLQLAEDKNLIIMTFDGVDAVMLDSGGTEIQVHIETGANGSNKLDFAQFKRRKRGNRQAGGTERSGLSVHQGRRRTVKNPQTPATGGGAPERWHPRRSAAAWRTKPLFDGPRAVVAAEDGPLGWSRRRAPSGLA